jgi:hypothetical protein
MIKTPAADATVYAYAQTARDGSASSSSARRWSCRSTRAAS